MPNPLIEFGIRLASLREDQYLSQNDLAEKIGRTRGTISLWERGLIQPKLLDLQLLCKELKTNPEFLLFGTWAANTIKYRGPVSTEIAN